jgi:hypothetical protein
MERQNKYLVSKWADIEKYLTDDQQLKLDSMLTKVRVGRLNDGKQDQQYVCVAADWPMYETVWKMVEDYVDGKPDEIESLRARVAELEQQYSTVQQCYLEYQGRYIAAQARVAELEKNAERYRYCRQAWIKHNGEILINDELDAAVDAAVDAAMKEGK